MERTTHPPVDGDGPAAGSSARARSTRTRRWWRRTRARTRAVRARVRRTPAGRFGWRIGVGLVGGLLLVVGVLAIPGPGQGWALVFLSLAILSTEFSWAHRARVALWERLVAARATWSALSPGRRAAVGVGLALLVTVCVSLAWWLSLSITGLPGWFPVVVSDVLTRLPGVD